MIEGNIGRVEASIARKKYYINVSVSEEYMAWRQNRIKLNIKGYCEKQYLFLIYSIF